MSGGNTILPWFAYDSQVGHLYLSEREENRKQKTKKALQWLKSLELWWKKEDVMWIKKKCKVGQKQKQKHKRFIRRH